MSQPVPALAPSGSAASERLDRLFPKRIDLGLDRLREALRRLGDPQRHMPPVIHVAGTNGKGSTCAFLRAIAEAGGMRVHATTSPHLVSFRERIRLAGRLVEEDALLAAIEAVAATGAEVTVFEALVACAFLLFSRTPADLCVVEVGLGGRLDATNLVEPPLCCAITSISMDHQDMLGETLPLIAREKAGILKPGVPAVTGRQAPEALAVLREEAARVGAPLLERGRDWEVWAADGGLRFRDAAGEVALPSPSLIGPHQMDNAGIAVAAARAAGLPAAGLPGIARARWPGRMQRLHGRLAALLPGAADDGADGWELWLDGGHNAGGGAALAEVLAGWRDRPTHLVVGMKQSKDVGAFLRPLLPLAASIWAVLEPGQHLGVPVEAVVAASGGRAQPGPTVAEALGRLAREERPGRVLICGSLYLVGEVLKADGVVPE